MKKEYTNGPELVKAMLENWDIAFSVLRRGDVPGFEEISENMEQSSVSSNTYL